MPIASSSNGPRRPNRTNRKQKPTKEKRECGICLDEINEGKKFGLLENCDHVFCLQCINTWKNSQGDHQVTCPVCRKPSSKIVPSLYFLNGVKKATRFRNYEANKRKYRYSSTNRPNGSSNSSFSSSHRTGARAGIDSTFNRPVTSSNITATRTTNRPVTSSNITATRTTNRPVTSSNIIATQTTNRPGTSYGPYSYPNITTTRTALQPNTLSNSAYSYPNITVNQTAIPSNVSPNHSNSDPFVMTIHSNISPIDNNRTISRPSQQTSDGSSNNGGSSKLASFAKFVIFGVAVYAVWKWRGSL